MIVSLKPNSNKVLQTIPIHSDTKYIRATLNYQMNYEALKTTYHSPNVTRKILREEQPSNPTNNK